MHETFSIKTSVKATVIFSKDSAGPSRVFFRVALHLKPPTIMLGAKRKTGSVARFAFHIDGTPKQFSEAVHDVKSKANTAMDSG
jgi:hypothetical protein